MPAISEIKSQGNNKSPFSNTLEEKQQGDHQSLPLSWRNTRTTNNINGGNHISTMNFKKDISWSYIKMLLLSNPYILYYQQNIILSRHN
ncbi:TPA: hypothetical protein ACGEYN_005760 [Raoultella ornithinolytica]